MPSSKIYSEHFFPPSFLPFFSCRTPELPAQMKIRMIPGMPGGPGAIAHGPVEGEPPTL